MNLNNEMQPLDMSQKCQILLLIRFKFKTSPGVRPANKSRLNNRDFSF